MTTADKAVVVRRSARGQTLAEVLVAIGVLSVIVVFITADLSNVTRVSSTTDRSIEVSAANYFLGVMKSDGNFWSDWNSGPSDDPCLTPLGPYTDLGPSPSPNWHDMPSPPPNCPAYPFTDEGAPQSYPSGGSPAPAVGNAVQYMWNASFHGTDQNAADLTVWVRRDANSPTFEYHGIRYQYPGSSLPTGSPPPSPTPCPTCTPPPSPSPRPSRPPTPQPSPTPIGV